VNGGKSGGKQHLMNSDESETHLTPIDFNLQVYFNYLIFPV